MEKNTLLVSIIIPVYNIGKELLNRCMISVVNQTYSNIEIIVVDDGSTDGSGEICEKWKETDNRILVIHRINGGLSAARNTGIKVATGNYIAFVDSDDWIENCMIERLVESIVKNDSDLSMCGICSTDGSKKINLPWYETDILLTKNEAYSELIKNEKISSHAWNKLYKTEIIRNVQFPEGKLYEDIRMMHFVFKKCNSVAIVSECLYNYYRRPGSISMIPKIHNREEYFNAFKERYDYVVNETPEFENIVLSQMAASVALSLVQCNFQKDDINKNKDILKNFKKFLNMKDIKKAYLRKQNKRMIIYFYIAKYLGYHSNWVYRTILKKHTRSYKEWN